MRPLLSLALLVALVLAACTGGSEAPAGQGFYAEITAEVEPDIENRFAVLDGETPGLSSVRWWYAEGADKVGRWRWEADNRGPSIDAGRLTTVFDGEYQWHYDDRLHGYQRTETPSLPEGAVLSPSFGAPVGPANLPDIDTFIEQWSLNIREQELVRTGEETVLGRETVVFEIRPPSGATNSRQSSSIIRLSLDPERMFIMRWVIDNGADGRSSTIEVSRLDYDIPIDADRFTFNPPSGARDTTAAEQSADCSVSMGGGSGLDAPAGFLDPAYSPSGFGSVGISSESGSSSCGPVATQTRVEHPDGGFIILRQRLRPTGIPPALRTDDTIQIHGRDAYTSEVAGITRLVWSRDDVVAELLGNTLPIDELVRIAESAQLRPRDDRQ